MLQDWYKRASSTLNTEDYTLSKVEFLSQYIFGFNTFDIELDEMWVKKALEVALTINERESLMYKSRNFYCWYVTMMNFEFFKVRTVWTGGTRSASWISSEFEASGVLTLCGEPISWSFSEDTWPLFIVAIDNFLRSR